MVKVLPNSNLYTVYGMHKVGARTRQCCSCINRILWAKDADGFKCKICYNNETHWQKYLSACTIILKFQQMSQIIRMI